MPSRKLSVEQSVDGGGKCSYLAGKISSPRSIPMPENVNHPMQQNILVFAVDDACYVTATIQPCFMKAMEMPKVATQEKNNHLATEASCY